MFPFLIEASISLWTAVTMRTWRGGVSIMVIIAGNGTGNLSSNAGWGFVLMLSEKSWINLFSHQLWVNNRAE